MTRASFGSFFVGLLSSRQLYLSRCSFKSLLCPAVRRDYRPARFRVYAIYDDMEVAVVRVVLQYPEGLAVRKAEFGKESNTYMKEGGVIMLDVSRVTSKGQVTIPVEMRRKLGIKNGDKVVFIEEGSRIVIANAAMVALKEIQEAFSGEAERLGLRDEQDVVNMVKEVRREMWEERHGGNA
jgi:AbrB family looped-hinge helix DNA binding protein